MKDILLLLSVIITCIKLSLSANWKVEYKANRKDPPVTEVLLRKGEYLPLIINFLKNNSDKWKINGKLTLVHEHFKLLSEPEVDLTGQRQYVVFIGASCEAKIKPGEKYQLTFKLDSEDNNFIDWSSIQVTVEDKKTMIELKVLRTDLELDSYSLYTVSSVRNVDEIVIHYTSDITTGIHIMPYTLPPFNRLTRRGLPLYGTFTASYEKDREIIVTPSTSNQCFTLTDKLTWRMALKNLPDILDKKEYILADTDVDRPVADKIKFHMKIDYAPVLVSCGLSPFKDEKVLTQDIITHPLKHGDIRNINLDFFQTYHQYEGAVHVSFSRTNRFTMGHVAVCYIQTLIFRNNQEEQETLKIVIANTGPKDKMLTLQSELPFPTQCLIWKFKEEFSITDLENGLISYCKKYFSAEKSLNERGCLYCDVRPRVAMLNKDIGICIRSNATCPINYSGNVKDDVAAFLKTIDTKEKMSTNVGLSVPEIASSYHNSDDNPLDTSKFETKIVGVSMLDVKLTIISHLEHSADCLVKQINKQPFVNVTEGDFVDVLEIVSLYPNRDKPVQFKFSKEGYDNITYSIVMMCFHFGDYMYHSRHTLPFVLTTFLRTDAIPPAEIPEVKHDCSKDIRHVQCIPHSNIPLPPLRGSGYRPDIDSELYDFSTMTIGYKLLMLNDEYEELKKATMTKDIIDKTIYLLELMPIEDCVKHQNYTHCRELKKKMVDDLVAKYTSLFEEKTFLTFIEKISDHPRITLPLIAMTLFDFGNNPDAYSLSTLNKIILFTKKLVDNYDALLQIIDKQAPASDLEADIEENRDLIANAKQDFTHLLFLAHVNLFDAFTYLELDKVILVNETTKVVSHPYMRTLQSSFEKMLPYLAQYNLRSVVSHNINLAIINKLQSNSDEYKLNFDKYDIKILYQKADILKSSMIDLLYIFSMDKFPFIPFMSTSFYNHSVSFRLYKKTDKGIEESNATFITPHITVLYNMKGINDKFIESVQYDTVIKTFINKGDEVKVVSMNNNTYTQIKLTKIGDFTFGVKGLSIYRRQWSLWSVAIPIGSIIGGVLIIVGVFFFVKGYLKKRKLHIKDNLDDINPILQG